MNHVKKIIRNLLARSGYVIRSIERGNGVSGIDMFHDVNAILGTKHGAVLFDVGANIGQTVESFLGAFRNPQIRSFEPSPVTFERLRRAHDRTPHVILENMALGDREDTLPFHMTRQYSVNDSLLLPMWGEGMTTVPVRVRTLDQYCEEHGIGAIDFLKIDTQGYDLHVLRGASALLGASRIGAFCIELIFSKMYHSSPCPIEMLSFVDQTGYRLVGFYDQSYINGDIQYINALFRN